MQRCRFHMWNCSYAVIKAGLRVFTAGQVCAAWLGPSHQRSMRARCSEPHGRRMGCSGQPLQHSGQPLQRSTCACSMQSADIGTVC